MFLACALFISIAAFGQMPSVSKWSQLPDMTGYDWSSETQVPSAVADDWVCENGMPINQITWWGSYYTPAIYPFNHSDNWSDPTIPNNTPPGTVIGFIISIYSDAGPSGAYSWNHPGDLLFSTTVEATETLYGVATKPGGQQENVWEYNVLLKPEDWFDQELGTTYWLSIVAINSLGSSTFIPSIEWGWHQTNLRFAEDAVQSGFNQNIEWDLLVDTEMAFELGTIPEPSTLTLIVSSLGLFGIFVRRRSR